MRLSYTHAIRMNEQENMRNPTIYLELPFYLSQKQPMTLLLNWFQNN